MRRKLLRLATAVSLLLFVATAGLWARSYSIRDSVSRTLLAPDGTPRVNTISVASDSGQLMYQRTTVGGGLGEWSAADAHARVHGWLRQTTKPEVRYREWWPRKQRVGVALSVAVIGLGYVIPLWLPTVLLALPSIWVASRWALRSRRDRQNRCVDCGYDLRATPDRCPECGAVPREPPHNPPMQRTATAATGAIE